MQRRVTFIRDFNACKVVQRFNFVAASNFSIFINQNWTTPLTAAISWLCIILLKLGLNFFSSKFQKILPVFISFEVLVFLQKRPTHKIQVHSCQKRQKWSLSRYDTLAKESIADRQKNFFAMMRRKCVRWPLTKSFEQKLWRMRLWILDQIKRNLIIGKKWRFITGSPPRWKTNT